MLTQPVPDTQTLATHILTTFGPHTVDGIDFGTDVAAARARHALATALVSNAHPVRDAAASPKPSWRPPHPVEANLSYTRCPWCADYLERDTRDPDRPLRPARKSLCDGVRRRRLDGTPALTDVPQTARPSPPSPHAPIAPPRTSPATVGTAPATPPTSTDPDAAPAAAAPARSRAQPPRRGCRTSRRAPGCRPISISPPAAPSDTRSMARCVPGTVPPTRAA
jgi:hypothetical protein